MSLVLVLFVIAFIAFLFSQFGGRLAARSSIVWWFALLFIFSVSVSPEQLEPIAHFFGVQLVSNFVLAALILFLMFELLQQSALNTQHVRRFRDAISTIAARDYKPKDSSPGGQKRALVVVPCFNEEDSIPLISDRLKALRARSDYGIDVCIVNDGSLDRSERVLKEHFPSEYVTHSSNLGVSGALLTGLKIARRDAYDFVVQCDADGQHPIESIPELLKAAEAEGADLLIGSRFKRGKKLRHESTTVMRRSGSLLIIAFLQIFRRVQGISDPTSGFRVYSRRACELLLRFMPDEYPEPETIAILALRGGTIAEYPVNMAPRTAGTSSLAGISGVPYMIKVITALIGLRLRSLARNRSVQLGEFQ